MFNLTNIPVHVNDMIFGDVSEITEDAPARQLGPTILVALVLRSGRRARRVLWSRYRRLAP